MKKLSAILFFLLIFFEGSLFAQATLSPAPAQSQAIAITGATIHVGNGKVLENASIVFENGKITQIGSSVKLGNAKQIDGSGKQVYPGFIAVNSILGLAEIEAVRATRDFNETGELNPNVRAIVAYDADSDVPPTVRSNGVLLAQIVPQGGVISGTSSVVNLDAWNWEDAAYQKDGGLWVNWPTSRIYDSPWASPADEQKKRNEENLNLLKNFLSQARAYSEIDKPKTKNLRFEGVNGIFDGSKTLFVRADAAKDIIAAVAFCKSLNVNPIIVGGEEAYLITDFLKTNQIAIMLSQPHALPEHAYSDVALPYKRAALLSEAGVKFCISMDGFWQQRNLPFMAGTAAAYGLTAEEALTAITLGTAQILGIEEHCGSLEVGKDATLFISEGDALDMRTNKVTNAFIQGRKIDLDNKQKQLYRKFTDKYQAQGLIDKSE